MDSFSIFSFPDTVIQEIIAKMTIVNTIKMRKTCSSMNSFIESSSRFLASRVGKGLSPFIMPLDGSIKIKIGNSKIELAEGFEKKFSGIPIKELNMETRSASPSQIQEMIKTLEAWKPICRSLITDPRLSDEDFYAMHKHVRCFGPLKIKIIEANEVAEKVEKLHKIGNPGSVDLMIYEDYNSWKFFEQMRPFGKVMAKISGASATRFLQDLTNSSYPVNLIDANLSLTSDMDGEFEFPHETLLEVSGNFRERQAAVGVHLLRLQDNKLAIVGLKIPEEPNFVDPMNLRVLVIPDNDDFKLVSMIQTCLRLDLEDEKEKIVAAPMEEKLEMIRAAFEKSQRGY